MPPPKQSLVIAKNGLNLSMMNTKVEMGASPQSATVGKTRNGIEGTHNHCKGQQRNMVRDGTDDELGPGRTMMAMQKNEEELTPQMIDSGSQTMSNYGLE